MIYQSPSIEGALGYTPDEIIGTRFDRLLLPGQNNRLLRLLAEGRSHSGDAPGVIECSFRHRDGSTRQFEILHTNLLEDEAVGGIVLNGRDISERKAFEQQLEHQAFHDPVTQLPNRALLNERARHALARGRRDNTALAVIFLDLDDFKTINDSLGHAAGDQVLLEVAKRLETSIRASDTAARFGGDEFAILLEDPTGAEEAADVAERITEKLKQPLQIGGKEIIVRASLGISIVDQPSALDADELIRNADAAMYIAKRDGKGSCRLFEPAMPLVPVGGRFAGHIGPRDRGHRPGEAVRAVGRGRGHRVSRAMVHPERTRLRVRPGLLLRPADGLGRDDRLPAIQPRRADGRRWLLLGR